MTDNTIIASTIEAPTAPVTEAPASNVVATSVPAVEPTTTTPTPTAPTSSWLDSLPDELKNDPNITKFKDVNELAKSYTNAQSLIGKRVKDLSGEDLETFKAAIGVPKEVTEYALPEELDPSYSEWYKDVALKSGLTKEQARNLADAVIMKNRESAEAIRASEAKSLEDAEKALRAEFGAAYKERIEIVKRAATTFGGQEFLDLLTSNPSIGNNPLLLKALANAGKALVEDRLVKADATSAMGITPRDATHMINQKLLDPEFKKAYFTGSHPQHKEAVAEMTRLHGLASVKN